MFNKKMIFKNDKKGFTLIELLVTLAIIGLLATMAVTAVNYARGQARIGKAQNDINEIAKAMAAMSNDSGFWPGHQVIDTVNVANGNEICGDTGAGACAYGLSAPEAGIAATDGTYDNWAEPYMQQIPLDAWGNQYFFDTDYRVTSADNLPCNGAPLGCTDAVVVGSYGPDGVGNGQYNEDDIIKILVKL
jgi:prepilin-type N-terminal cleavage/methylation domain-containing protein